MSRAIELVVQAVGSLLAALVCAVVAFVVTAGLVVAVEAAAGGKSESNAAYNDAASGMLSMVFAVPVALITFGGIFIWLIAKSRRSPN